MGAWGAGILQNDTSAAIHDEYVASLRAGASCPAATREVRAAHGFEFTNRDCAADAWLAVALGQWKFDKLEPSVLRRVERAAGGWGQDLWRESTPRNWAARQRVLAAFVAKLSRPPQRPLKPEPVEPIPTLTAPFAIGDCLAVRLSDGTWGAAIVTGLDEEQLLSKRQVQLSVIGQLDYHSKRAPTMPVFQARRWLKLTHSGWGGRRAIWNIDGRGFKSAKARFVCVGTLRIRRSDPTVTDFYSDWAFGEQILLEHGHRRRRA